jgi:hypothetical protein
MVRARLVSGGPFCLNLPCQVENQKSAGILAAKAYKAVTIHVMRKRRWWVHEHGLSLVIGGGLLLWLVLYWRGDPSTHLGAFYGNAVADWFGSLVTVVATKFWFEKGSPESRVPPFLRGKGPRLLHEHSLTVALLLTWTGWIWWYLAIDVNGKTGQVVGNIVSEWSQILSLVWFTKYLVERGSKESGKR